MDNTQEQTTPEQVETQQPENTLLENTAEAPESAETKPEVAAEKPEGEEDYSWVPAKFLRDGKPDFQTLSKSYQALEKKIGQKGNFAPESVEEYDYTPTRVTFDETEHAAFKEDALKAGLSPEQFKWMLAKYEDAYEQTAETPEKAKAHLEKSWGGDFDKNMKNAIRAFETYVPSNIPMSAVGNNPYVIEVLARVGAELAEDTTPVKANSSVGRKSKEDIQALIKDADYWDNPAKQKMVYEWHEKNSK